MYQQYDFLLLPLNTDLSVYHLEKVVIVLDVHENGSVDFLWLYGTLGEDIARNSLVGYIFGTNHSVFKNHLSMSLPTTPHVIHNFITNKDYMDTHIHIVRRAHPEYIRKCRHYTHGALKNRQVDDFIRNLRDTFNDERASGTFDMPSLFL